MAARYDPLLGELVSVDPSIEEVKQLINGCMKQDGSNYVGDLTLVTPTITATWTIKDKNNNLIKTDKSTSISVEKGAKVDFNGTFKYSAPSDIQKPPTRCDGSFGNTLPAAGSSSSEITSQGITTTKSFTVNLYANKSGLIVKNNKVLAATGEDSTSATASVTFKHMLYYGASSNASVDVKTLTPELVTSRSKTITFNCSGGKYFYIAYPTELGKATFNIGGLTVGIDPTSTSITNEYGEKIDYYIYRSADLQTGSAIKVIIS